MKFVVDTNYLQDEKLRKFLESNTKNIAIITDYAKREIQKTVSIEKIRLSLQILSEFPDQVVFLKGTTSATKNSGRLSGLQKRLICKKETDNFKQFCRYLYGETEIDVEVQKKFLDHSLKEKDFLDELAENKAETIEIYLELKSRYSSDGLRKLRRAGYPDTAESVELLLSLMSELTTQLLSNVPGGIKKPQNHEFPNLFLYRISLFCALHFQEWLIKGCPENLRNDRLRNDYLDINFATFATFFDGLLTNDQKCYSRYAEGRMILENALIPFFEKK